MLYKILPTDIMPVSDISQTSINVTVKYYLSEIISSTSDEISGPPNKHMVHNDVLRNHLQRYYDCKIYSKIPNTL